jgi:hypothetical protein
MMMPMFAGLMLREARIMRMVTMLALGTPGTASDPTLDSTLQHEVKVIGDFSWAKVVNIVIVLITTGIMRILRKLIARKELWPTSPPLQLLCVTQYQGHRKSSRSFS